MLPKLHFGELMVSWGWFDDRSMVQISVLTNIYCFPLMTVTVTVSQIL